MKKLNPENLTVEFNKLRQKNQDRVFSGKEINLFLEKYNFNRMLVAAMKRANVFICERVGTSRLYQFRKEPLYVVKMGEIIKDYRRKFPHSRCSEEEKAINFLKSKGCQIQVYRGFDEVRFAKENPELYKKYLIYETI